MALQIVGGREEREAERECPSRGVHLNSSRASDDDPD